MAKISWISRLKLLFCALPLLFWGCGGSSSPSDTPSQPPSRAAYLQYRTTESSAFSYGWIAADTSTIQKVTLKDSTGNPVQMVSTAWKASYQLYDCTGTSCAVGTPYQDLGFVVDNLPPALTSGSFTYEMLTNSGQTISTPVSYAGVIPLPPVPKSSMIASKGSSDITFSWSNPTAAANWDKVAAVWIDLYDNSIAEKRVSVRMSATAQTVKVPISLINSAGLNPDSATLVWRIQTRYTLNGVNVARGLSDSKNVNDNSSSPIYAGEYVGTARVNGSEAIFYAMLVDENGAVTGKAINVEGTSSLLSGKVNSSGVFTIASADAKTGVPGSPTTGTIDSTGTIAGSFKPDSTTTVTVTGSKKTSSLIPGLYSGLVNHSSYPAPVPFSLGVDNSGKVLGFVDKTSVSAARVIPITGTVTLSNGVFTSTDITTPTKGTFAKGRFLGTRQNDMYDGTREIISFGKPQGTPPVANAGSNVTIPIYRLVTLDGSGSTVAAGRTLSYLWALTSSPSGSAPYLSGSSDPRPFLVVDKAGSYVLRLTVNDGASSSSSTITLVASEPQSTPTSGRFLGEMFPSAKVTKDIPYTSVIMSDGSVQQLLLDLYEPEGDTVLKRPAIVWIHGGGYYAGGSGDKSNYSGTATDFAKLGYVGISINYRLVSQAENNSNSQLTNQNVMFDAKAAVRWLRRYADQYRIDPQKIAIGGVSGGAMIAVNAAYNDEDGNSGNSGYSSAVQAVIDTSGKSMAELFGMTRTSQPPLTIFHGTSDTIVSPFNAVYLAQRAEAIGLTYEFHPAIGSGHEGQTASENTSHAFLKAFLYWYFIP